MPNHTHTFKWRITPPSYAKAIILAALTAFSVPAFATDPLPPPDLRHIVYSNTAAELFWGRAKDNGLVLSYEVRLNGNVVSSRDATSYFTNSLTLGQTYNVELISIDNQGNRSEPATLSFVGGERPGTEPPKPPEPPNPDLEPPTGLTGSVYSRKSVEIFWDRPAAFGLTYEISRNREVIKTTDGVSHFDNQLSPGSLYSYEVVAINSRGERSEPASILVYTRGDDGTTGGVTDGGTDGNTSGTTDSGTDGGTSGATDSGTDAGTSGTTDSGTDAGTGGTTDSGTDGGTGGTTDGGTDGGTGGTTDGGPINPSIVEPADVYTREGYSPLNVIRVDLRTAIESGPCNADDETGCTLDDVMADIDKTDDHTVDIKVHFQSDDFADDGSVSNAELRLRGGGSRFAPQKSFRIKLDSKKVLWRGERHLQLNKHPFDLRRARNKVAMDVMSQIPNLPSMRTQFVNLWIDDGEGPVDYGLFTHVERVNGNYLRQREWNEDDRLYKAEYFRFAKSDIPNLQVDEEGEPLDEDLFETTLELENGDDHRTLVAMMNALHNPNRSFKSVLDQYFDKDNVMAWMAANILLRQNDAVRHNFILYNPIGSEKFFFLPWDYDGAVTTWQEPPNDLSNDSLRQRFEYGYALASRNPFLDNFYRQPGIHQELLDLVKSLRQNHVTDEYMTAKIDDMLKLIPEFQTRAPDSVHNPDFLEYAIRNMADVPRLNEEALESRFNVLMPPVLNKPTLAANQWSFSWSPAFDVTGAAGSITYQLQIAQSPSFEADSIFVDIGAIDNSSGVVTQNVDADQLPSGEYFARLIATPANEPERNWQVSGNKLYYNNNVYYGALQFEVE